MIIRSNMLLKKKMDRVEERNFSKLLEREQSTTDAGTSLV